MSFRTNTNELCWRRKKIHIKIGQKQYTGTNIDTAPLHRCDYTKRAN